MGVERDRTRFQIGWYQWMILGVEGKPSKLGSGGFFPPSDEDSVIWAIDCDVCFSNIIRQSWSHNLPIPIKLWWEFDIIWPDMTEIDGRSNSQDSNY